MWAVKSVSSVVSASSAVASGREGGECGSQCSLFLLLEYKFNSVLFLAQILAVMWAGHVKCVDNNKTKYSFAHRYGKRHEKPWIRC
jgi:hypothetical protein